MTEPDVAITDYLLAIESLWLATLLVAQPAGRADLQLWFVVFFAATGIASVLGGTFHGFCVAHPSHMGRWIWRKTVLAIGVTTSATWMIGASMLWPGADTGWLTTMVAGELIVFAAIVVFVTDAFRVAVINHLPATIFLIVAYAMAYRAAPEPAVALGLAGLVLTIVAGLVQRLKAAVHPVYFTHNAVFHVLHGIALFLIFLSGRLLIAR